MGGGTPRRVSNKLCPLYSFEASTVAIILGHLRIVHSSDPRFIVTCGLEGCAITCRSFSALYSHIYRHHSSFIKKRATATTTTLDDSPVLSEQSVDLNDLSDEAGKSYS